MRYRLAAPHRQQLLDMMQKRASVKPKSKKKNILAMILKQILSIFP